MITLAKFENSGVLEMAGPSILVIDDEEVLLEAVSDDLRESGYQVTTANSGDEGLNSFKKLQHDLVIIDLKWRGRTAWRFRRKSNN